MTDRIGQLVPVAEARAYEPRMARCEEALDRLVAVVQNFCDYIGIPIEDLEPLPTRLDLTDDPAIEDWGTNTYYPGYVQKGVGTSDDSVLQRMDCSPLNPGPHFEAQGSAPAAPVATVVPITSADPTTPAPTRVPVQSPEERPISCPTPVEDSRVTSLPEAPPSISALPRHSLSPVPELSTPPESPPVPTAPCPVPVPDDSRLLESPAPPEVPSASLTDSDLHRPEPPVGTSDVPDRPITPQLNLIQPTPQNSQEDVLSPVVLLEPTVLDVGPVAVVRIPDSTSSTPVSPPAPPTTRTRSPHPPAPTPMNLLDSLAVPDWPGVQTRASSRARSVSSGRQTRASSRARSVTPGLGDKRKAEESSDEKVSKRRKD